MKNKVLTILALTALVLGVSACGKKEVASVVSEVTSVTEKVQETSTSIAEKIDSINSTEGKTDLSEHPEVEVPEVPEVPDVPDVVEETSVLSNEEFYSELDKLAERWANDEESDYVKPEPETDEWYELISDYISVELDDESIQDITLKEYFGENYKKIPYATEDETIGHYRKIESSYSEYLIAVQLDDFLLNYGVASTFPGKKDLTREDFHKDFEGSLKLWNK